VDVANTLNRRLLACPPINVAHVIALHSNLLANLAIPYSQDSLGAKPDHCLPG
jgi:hypothetical protein